MRFLVIMILAIATASAFGFDCSVTCPKNYYGACVKSDGGCDCSCSQQARDAKDGILSSLRAAGASQELIDRVQRLLSQQTELPETTLASSGKQFAIFLRKQQ